LSADLVGGPAARQQPASITAPKPKPNYRQAALSGLKWGLIVAIPLGLLGGVCMWIMFWDNVGTSGAVSGFEFGALVGFMIGSIWGVTSTLELAPGIAAIYGTGIGGAEMLVNYGIEAAAVSVPDHGAHMYALMGCGAGAVAGWASMMLKEYHDER